MLSHFTENTGHLVKTARSDVSIESLVHCQKLIYEALRVNEPILIGDNNGLENYSFLCYENPHYLNGVSNIKCLIFIKQGPIDIPIISFTVVAFEPEPFISVVIYPMDKNMEIVTLTHFIDAMTWAADFERSIAWAFITTIEESKQYGDKHACH